MTQTLPHIKPIYAIFCDDIRREVTGKEILIGVYTGNLLVPHFPAPIVLATWIPYERIADAVGKIPIEFRMLNVVDDNENRSVGYGSLELMISDTSDTGSISLPALAIMLNRPGKLIFQLKQYDEPWQTIASLKLDIRPGSAISPASGPSPPSSQSAPVAQESTSPPVPSRPAPPTRRRRS